MPHRALTLSQFLLQERRDHPDATGEFATLLTDIALAAKMINREVVRAGLVDILGYTGRENVHGEKVQRLDVFAHETLLRVLGSTGQLAVFGPGDHLVVTAADRAAEPFDVLVLGGLPIRAPIAHYGPFVMNTRDEIRQAIEDFEAGRLGIIPAGQLAPRNFA